MLCVRCNVSIPGLRQSAEHVTSQVWFRSVAALSSGSIGPPKERMGVRLATQTEGMFRIRYAGPGMVCGIGRNLRSP